MLVPAFHLEDVYITGILPSTYNRLLSENINEVLMNKTLISSNADTPQHEREIHPIDDERFNIEKIDPDPCLYQNLISSHSMEPGEILHIHGLISKLRLKPGSIRSRTICNYSTTKEKRKC